MAETPFAALVRVMAQLRSDEGCPWDREQTHESLKPYLLEEAYEVLECIDENDAQELCTELGDLLLQVVFHAQIGSETAAFDIDQVCRAVLDKLIRRHPHVFADTVVDNADEVVVNWERIKQEERKDAPQPPSILDGVPPQLPALLRAQRLQGKASRVGFDWDQIEGPLKKVSEELEELREARSAGEEDRVEEEFGDLLFAMVNVGRFLKLCPEDALRRASGKFERRFQQVEAVLNDEGREIGTMSLAELDRVWERVKDQS
jgi:tetrapyrrole methylase family protein/MazG family protein